MSESTTTTTTNSVTRAELEQVQKELQQVKESLRKLEVEYAIMCAEMDNVEFRSSVAYRRVRNRLW